MDWLKEAGNFFFVEFSTYWVWLIVSSWCSSKCSSIPHVSWKLVITRPGGLIRFCFSYYCYDLGVQEYFL